MENLTIQQVWKQNEMLLDKTRKLNGSLLKEVKLEKAKSSLKRLLFLPISTLVFFVFWASYALYFAVVNWEHWYFTFSGAVVSFFSILFIVASILQLKQILSINYNEPVVKLQKDISKIKISVIQNLRLAAYVLPFSPFIGLFLFKALFSVDLVEWINYNMLISLGILTIILEVLSLLLLRALRPKNSNNKWVNWLLQGSGSQVDEALRFLKQVEEFEKEEILHYN
jgi:hypothetical protein